MAGTTPVARAAVTLAPMSATAAELLHRLQQEAADAVAPADGTILLSPPAAACDYYRATETSCTAYFGDCRVSLFRHRGYAYWTGDEERTDGDGRRWERRIKAVVDNFGELIEGQS